MISRRDFLGKGLAMGGLVAAAQLPTLADDEPALFPSRGPFERLALAYQHVHVGLPKPFSILHISDTHLTEAYDSEPAHHAFRDLRRRTFGGRQQEALRDALAWAKLNVDYVLHTGDLIDFQTQANLDLVRKCYGAAAGGIFGCTGNHEYQRRVKEEGVRNTTEYNRLSLDVLSKTYPFDTVFQSTVVNGVNFICIEQTYGFVTPEQVEKFHAEAKRGLPIVLCMHAPFYTPAIWRACDKYWHAGRKFTSAAVPPIRGDYTRQEADAVTQKFLAYLRGEPLLKAILAGHLHITVQDRFSPTAVEYVVGGNFLFHGQEILFT